MPHLSEKDVLTAPLKRARGLGSAHHGVEHWWAQKITALANIPLILWLVWSIIDLYSDGASYELFTSWVAAPINAILLIALFINIFYHAKLGAQVVVEDYISNGVLKKIKLIAHKMLFSLLTIACVFSVLKIAFTG